MKTRSTFTGNVFRALTAVILLGLLTIQCLSAQDWYNAGWQYRTQVTISNPGGTVLSDYQVQIILSSPDFDFTKVLNDGSDIRVTSDDGITPIPFWIENSWHAAGPDTIWAKVPVIPAVGTTVFIYYGNPTPPLAGQIEVPPVRTYTKEDTWIDPIDDPGDGEQLLAENMVYDDETGHYWLIFRNSRTSPVSIGLIWSDTPSDPDSWHWYEGNPVITSGDAPHIMKEGDKWYIFYGDRSGSSPYPISVQSADHVYGPYGAKQEVLQPGASGSWEDYRVDEPYVFQRTDGKWIIVYMGDSPDGGGPVEQIGYAISDNLLTGYEKFSGNPMIPLGPTDSFDNEIVADPWVYYFDGVYYIGYAGVNNTTGICPHTAYVTTSDWQTFAKQPVIVAPGSMTSYDNFGVFRGAVSRVDDDYVFIYTARYRTSAGGANLYRLGVATQPAVIEDPINDPREVFDFYEGFNDATLDPQAWYTNTIGLGGTAVISDGKLVLSAVSNGSNNGAVAVRSSLPVYFGTIMEYRGAHPTNGPPYDQVNVAQVGNIQYDFAWTNHLRFKDGPSTGYYEIRGQKDDGPTVNIETLIPFSAYPPESTRTYGVYRPSTGIAKFRIDNSAFATLDPTYVPTTSPLYPWMMSYAEKYRYSPSDFVVDWVRMRKFVETEPVVSSINEQRLFKWDGSMSADWATPGNWIDDHAPGSGDNITIPIVTTNYPVIDYNYTINPEGSLTIEAGAELTIIGDLTTNDGLFIESTVSSGSGSLIVSGTRTGDVTYNRFLRDDDDASDDEDKHLFSSPVGGQAISDFISNHELKIDSVRIWDEDDGVWSRVIVGSFESGKGYNVYQRAGSDGDFSFTGSVVNSASMTVTSPFEDPYSERGTDPYGNDNPELIDWTYERGFINGEWTNWGGGGWNLLGNPFTSAMNAETFITVNMGNGTSTNKFDPYYQALYVYDGVNGVYKYSAVSAPLLPEGSYSHGSIIQAGQGFMIMANNNNVQFDFTSTMQTHSTDVVMLKSAGTEAPWPGLHLRVRYGEKENATTIVYNDEMTTGLDPGYDVGQLSTGPAVEIYTIMTEKDEGVNLARQALPVTNADKIIVPVGIDTEKGGEFTFSAFTVQLGNNKFWLEDRTTGIFTDLTAKSYTVTLPAKTYGTGRFYIIASANTPTGIQDIATEDTGLRIWNAYDKIIIKGEVSEKALCEVYNLQGKKILDKQLKGGEMNTVDLPAGIRGVYLVRVTDGVKATTRKVAFP